MVCVEGGLVGYEAEVIEVQQDLFNNVFRRGRGFI
jgi:hypothetical protein